MPLSPRLFGNFTDFTNNFLVFMLVQEGFYARRVEKCHKGASMMLS